MRIAFCRILTIPGGGSSVLEIWDHGSQNRWQPDDNLRGFSIPMLLALCKVIQFLLRTLPVA